VKWFAASAKAKGNVFATIETGIVSRNSRKFG